MFLDDWDPDRMMNNGYHDGMDGGAWWMLVLALLLVAVLGVLVFLAFRLAGGAQPRDTARGSGPSVGPAVGSARDLLDQRLARGEISPEEYRATRALLEP